MSNNMIYMLDTYHPDAVAALHASGEKHVLFNEPDKHEWHSDANAILLRSDTRISRDDFRKAKSLQVIVKQGTGVDNVDLEAAREYGVAVHNTPAMNSEAVAEMSVALGLALARRLTEFDYQLRNNIQIPRSRMLGLSLHKKTVGVLGMGNIGRLAALKWKGACEMEILAHDPFAPANAWSDIEHCRLGSVEELFALSDVITIHCPLVTSTEKLVNWKLLKSMKQNAILINTARGAIIDEDALIEVLESGHLWGAALDAVTMEPPRLRDQERLLQAGRVIITPHAGAGTEEMQSKSGLAVIDTVLAVLAGKDAPGKLV